MPAEKVQAPYMNSWNFALNYVPGVMSGVSVILTGHPIDTIKVICQTSSERKSPQKVFLQTFRQGGMKALYRGVGSQLPRPLIFSGVLFGSYSNAKMALQTANFIDPHPEFCEDCLSFRGGFLAGLMTAPLVAFFATPLELVKCIQQTSYGGNTRLAKDVFQDIIRRNGIFGPWRGFLATVGRSSCNAFYFGTYEIMRRKESNFLTGSTCGLIFWTLCYPFDTLKSVKQTTDLPYKTILKDVTREERVFGLYRGFSTTLIRAVPVNIAAVATFEYWRSVINRYQCRSRNYIP